jgi:hypothetical protein
MFVCVWGGGVLNLAAGKKTETTVKFWCQQVEKKHLLPVAALVVVTIDTVASGHQHRASLVT